MRRSSFWFLVASALVSAAVSAPLHFSGVTNPAPSASVIPNLHSIGEYTGTVDLNLIPSVPYKLINNFEPKTPPITTLEPYKKIIQPSQTSSTSPVPSPSSPPSVENEQTPEPSSPLMYTSDDVDIDYDVQSSIEPSAHPVFPGDI